MGNRYALAILLSVALEAQAAFQGVSLKVGNETEPPGGMVQMKVFITEPTPISTGGTKVTLDAGVISSIDGIGLFGGAGDAVGAAVVRGTQLRLIAVSSSGTLGMNPDYPILTIAARIRPDAAPGTTSTLALDADGLFFTGLFGNYLTEFKPGHLAIAPGVSVTDVNPGSSIVPAGGVVTISGVNFSPLTTVRFNEAVIDHVSFVSDTRIDITLATPQNMHGQRIKVSNPDGSSSTYYSYQRTRPVLTSTRPLLAQTVPVFAPASLPVSYFVTPPLPAAAWFALAAQNLNPGPVEVRFDALSVNGNILGSYSVTLAPNTRFARSVDELLSPATPPGTMWRISSSQPIQTLALIGNDTTSVVVPLPAIRLN